MAGREPPFLAVPHTACRPYFREADLLFWGSGFGRKANVGGSKTSLIRLGPKARAPVLGAPAQALGPKPAHTRTSKLKLWMPKSLVGRPHESRKRESLLKSGPGSRKRVLCPRVLGATSRQSSMFEIETAYTPNRPLNRPWAVPPPHPNTNPPPPTKTTPKSALPAGSTIKQSREAPF